jgi:four helix bundle protein
MDTFEDLDCYKSARLLRIEISRCARQWPAEERYRLVDQVIRSSRSVTANIAEGFGRQHTQENLQFCRQARGSLLETLEHLNTALDESYISAEAYQSLRSQQWTTAKALLSGYIRYLESISPKDRRFTDRK